MKRILTIAALCASVAAGAQKYEGLVDKTVAIVGAEAVQLSEVEDEVRMMKAQGFNSDRNARCEVLEQMLQSKLFLMQARLDSLSVNREMVAAELNQRVDYYKTALGGEKEMEDFMRVTNDKSSDILYLDNPDVAATKGTPVEVMFGQYKGIQGKLLRVRKDRKVVLQLAGMVAIALSGIPMEWCRIIEE